LHLNPPPHSLLILKGLVCVWNRHNVTEKKAMTWTHWNEKMPCIWMLSIIGWPFHIIFCIERSFLSKCRICFKGRNWVQIRGLETPDNLPWAQLHTKNSNSRVALILFKLGIRSIQFVLKYCYLGPIVCHMNYIHG